MDLQLRGKTALVTGASSGLGNACARVLAEEGVQLVLCSRDADRIQDAAAEIARETAQRVVGIAADLRVAADREQLVQRAREALGNVDILVLSTGHPPTCSFAEATDEQWQEGIDLILNPVIALTRLLLGDMRQREYGRIIYIGSIFGLEAEKSSVIQSTLRTGLNAFSKCVATEAAADGVTANVICPGYFDTPLLTRLATQYASAANITSDEVLERWKAFSPTNSFGKPEDLAALVAYLASPRGSYVTGTSVVIDGGGIRQY